MTIGSRGGALGYDISTTSHLATVQARLRRTVAEVLEDAAADFVDTIMTDTLAAGPIEQSTLDAMGNPYGRRKAKTQMPNFPEWWRVHIQTGDLRSSSPLIRGFPETDGQRIAVTVSLDTSNQKVVDIHQGTDVMQPRPFLFYGLGKYGALSVRSALRLREPF